jgi:hypothetical protein
MKTLIQCKRTSSNRDGRIFLVRSCSENLSKTVVNPFINDIFSSRVLEVKFERSRKFRVDIGKEEKNGWEGSVVGEGRLFGCLVIDNRSKAGRYTRLWPDAVRNKGMADLEDHYPAAPYQVGVDQHSRATHLGCRVSGMEDFPYNGQHKSDNPKSTCRKLCLRSHPMHIPGLCPRSDHIVVTAEFAYPCSRKIVEYIKVALHRMLEIPIV